MVLIIILVTSHSVISYAVHNIGAGSFPIILNVFEFSPEEHNVFVEVTDSVGEVKTYVHRFMGMTPMGIKYLQCMHTA